MVQKLELMFKLLAILAKHPFIVLKQLNATNIKKLIHALRYKRPALVYESIKNFIGNHVRNAQRAKNPNMAKLRELEKKYPGITCPNAIYNSFVIEDKIKPIPYKILDGEKNRINVLLPQLDPLIMFGGYISVLQFIRKLILNGNNIRILICESNDFDRDAVLSKLSHNQELAEAVSKCEVVCVADKEVELPISPRDSFVAYSFWMGILAHQLAEVVNTKFIFFAQEYEAIFHPWDSAHALANYVYGLPHYAVLNTCILREYFRSNRLGVYKNGDQEGDDNSVCYQHALTKTSPAPVEKMRSRKKKKFLFYARPEDHAKRNLFEIGLIGLRMAVERGVFDDDEWEFIGVGTLGTIHYLSLGKGMELEMRSTLPQADYGEALKEFDLGLSLMFAPHPSILPFEMSSAGIVTITNHFENRSPEQLVKISGNIVPCEMNMYSVSEKIQYAVKNRVFQFEERHKNSDLKWVRDWNDSFNEEVIDKINQFIGDR